MSQFENNWLTLAVCLPILPLLVLGTLTYTRTYRELTASVLSQKQSVADLAATTVKDRLDRLTEIGVILANGVRFRQLVREVKWDQAVRLVADVTKDFPFIDRLFLVGPEGTLVADTPALPGMRGTNFAYRDWYQGVTKAWEPYVSGVYKRVAEPRLNVIAVAIPIKGPERSARGILVLQLPVNAILDWTKSINAGPGALVYVVDTRGYVAAHPGFLPDEQITDFSSVPAVQKSLRGERGVGVTPNPIENEKRVAAYAPVPGYGWGVITEEPTTTAFAARDAYLRRLLLAYGLVFLFSAALAYLIVRLLAKQKQTEERTRQLNLDLEAANKELEIFAYTVSQDLRAPLRAVDGFSRILLDDYAQELPAGVKHYVATIRRNAASMGELIEELLKFSRLSRQPLNRVPVKPGELVHQALQELRREQENRRVDIAIGDLPPCHADPALLKQVLANLLSNALKYTRGVEAAQIEVGCQKDNGEVAYFVKDNGAGFDTRHADKLLGAFQRLHRADDDEGTGVGLAIVRRIIQRHGGRVWAEADVNEGAKFYFTLGEEDSGR